MGKYILMSVYDPTQLRKKAPNGRSFFLLFGTRTGFAILFAGGILLFAILAFVMEKRTIRCMSTAAQVRGRRRQLRGTNLTKKD